MPTTVPPDGNAGTDHAHGHRDSDELVDLTSDDAKAAARSLRRTLADTGVTISHSRALEIVAAQLGFADWNTASARLSERLPARQTGLGPTGVAPTGVAPAGVAPTGVAPTSPGPTGPAPTGLGRAVPVLRVQDGADARQFYVDYLGFEVEWEHRFEAGMPLYLRVRRGEAVLDLSEYHGDGTPGTVVWVPVASADAFHAELSGRPHARLRPGVDRDAPGGPTIEVIDPFGNVLRFCEPTG